jgi:hypothetical protein
MQKSESRTYRLPNIQIQEKQDGLADSTKTLDVVIDFLLYFGARSFEHAAFGRLFGAAVVFFGELDEDGGGEGCRCC